MTLRLVALMSIVLLLCLGSFGLLVQHYHTQVMEEVARTASEVGRATLQTFEFKDPGEPVAFFSGPQHLMWSTSTEIADVPPVDGEAAAPGEGHAAVMINEFHLFGADDVELPQSGTRRVTMRRELAAAAGDSDVREVIVSCDVAGSSGELECKTDSRARQVASGMFVHLDEVRAETDPSQGLVLKIPWFATREGNESADFAHAQAQDVLVDVAPAALEEIELPIPLEDYENLFTSIRDRSMYLFLAVFLVGTALSAGLASRFTRPIRNLDAGIRRIGTGDLDASVETHGHDEIARLSRAFNDMTRKLRANRERSREMVRREKLTALGQLAAGVAHDVRNPLHSIGLTLQHLHETCRPEATERAVEFDRSLDIIRGEIRRLDQTVANFLRFARSDKAERQRVDLRELLRETVRLVGKEAELRNVEISLVLDDTAPEVLVDGESVRSAILNLVLNSFQAMPDGGRLNLTLMARDGEVVIDVADNGKGIPEEDQERIFDFAFTTRDGGNGLGLAIVHQCVVEDHGGRVSLDSTLGDGTRVRLALPVEPTRPKADASGNGEEESA